jgi:hypothetical protein
MLVAIVTIVINTKEKISIAMVTGAAINISAARIHIQAAVCRNLYRLFHQGTRSDNRFLNVVRVRIDPGTHKDHEQTQAS